MSAAIKPNAPYKGRMERYSDAVWLIWSNKWGCWYRAGSQGYTNDIAQAGLFDRAEAASHHIDRAKKYRITEPFPVSVVRKQIDLREQEILSRFESDIRGIHALRSALQPSTIGEGDRS